MDDSVETENEEQRDVKIRAQCLDLFAREGSVGKPDLVDHLKRYFEAKGSPEEVVQLLVDISDPVATIRCLMMMMRCKPRSEVRDNISRSLCSILVKDDQGLRNLMKATLDTDETSQKVTTLDQRYQATGNVVAFLPKFSCSLPEYYQKITPQVYSLLATETTSQRKLDQKVINSNKKIATAILNSLTGRNKTLANQFIINPVIRAIQCEVQETRPTLAESLAIVHGLVVCQFDVKQFIPIFPNLFYVRAMLQGHISHYRHLCQDILTDILAKVDHSEYLLDDAVMSKYTVADLYATEITETKQGAKGSTTIEIVRSYEEPTDYKTEVTGKTLEKIDNVVQLTVNLLSDLPDESKLDFFLLVINRLASIHLLEPYAGLLVAALMDSVFDKVKELLLKYPTKCIEFVVLTLDRVALEPKEENFKLILNNASFTAEEEEKRASSRFEKCSVSLDIIGIILNDKRKLTSENVRTLKQCLSSLDLLAEESSECDRLTIEKLKAEIESLNENEANPEKAPQESCFEEAIREVNDPLMPVRAHALLILKKLVYCKDPQTLENKAQVINILKACLNDAESYIYLAAISALAALSVVDTENVLPLLTKAFLEEGRSLQERINVGEAMVQLSRRIGEMSHHFSAPLINCFLTGIKQGDSSIQISSLSNLGQFCSVLKFGLKGYIVEIMHYIETLLKKSNTYLEVKRAAVMFIHLLLNGLDKDTVEAIQTELLGMYRLVKQVYSNSFDEVLELHAQLALEQINRIATQMLTPDEALIKRIQIRD